MWKACTCAQWVCLHKCTVCLHKWNESICTSAQQSAEVHSESVYASAQQIYLQKCTGSLFAQVQWVYLHTCTASLFAHVHSDFVYKSAQWACLHSAVSLFAQVHSESVHTSAVYLYKYSGCIYTNAQWVYKSTKWACLHKWSECTSAQVHTESLCTSAQWVCLIQVHSESLLLKCTARLLLQKQLSEPVLAAPGMLCFLLHYRLTALWVRSTALVLSWFKDVMGQ